MVTLRNSLLLLSFTAKTMMESIPCSRLVTGHVFHDVNENNCSPPSDQCTASPWSMSTLPTSLLDLLLSMVSYGVEYPLGQFGSAVPPPNPLCTLSLLVVGWGELLTQCKCYSAIAIICLCYQQCFCTNTKHILVVVIVKKINSIPVQTCTERQY